MTAVAVIGAAGRIFGPQILFELVEASLEGGRAEGLDVRLVDIDLVRLDRIAMLWRRAVAEERAPITITTTASLPEALDGVDVVVHAAQAQDPDTDRLSAKALQQYGYRREGSLFVAHSFWVDHRQLRLLDHIASECDRSCPDAWLLQLANPVFAGGTHLARTMPHLRVLGLCDGPTAVPRILRAAGFDSDDVAWSLAGVNHFVWLNRVQQQGANQLPLLVSRVRELANEDAANPFADMLPSQAELAARYGVVPIGDTGHELAGGWPWWAHAGSDAVGAAAAHDRVWKEMDDWYLELDQAIAALTSSSEPVMSGLPRFDSPAGVGAVIRALRGGRPLRLVANVVNASTLVPGIPEDVVVEVPVGVATDSVAPERTSPLPKPVLAWLLRDQLAPAELQLAAYREGRRDLLVDLLMTDPWSTSRSQAERAVDAVLSLPGNADLATHYR